MTREDAINLMKVIVHMLEEKYDTDRVEDAVDMAIKALEQEPKTGHWKPYLKEGLGYQCSACDSRFDTPWEYCPHCGAKMAESEE